MDIKIDIAEQVYDSLLGQLKPEYSLDWVENIFEEGKPYNNSYGRMLHAYERLCERLGTVDEDSDVEVIINALLDNEREVALKMFQYGRLYEKKLMPHR